MKIKKFARKKIGIEIFDIIKERNLKIEPLARKCKMEKKIIYNIMKGKGYTIDSFITLLHALNCQLVIKKKALQDKYDIFEN